MHAALCQPSACAVLTELKDQDRFKVIADCAGLSSTNKETEVVAFLMPPEVSWCRPM